MNNNACTGRTSFSRLHLWLFEFLSKYFFPNLSFQSWGAAYLQVQLIRRCFRYFFLGEQFWCDHFTFFKFMLLWRSSVTFNCNWIWQNADVLFSTFATEEKINWWKTKSALTWSIQKVIWVLVFSGHEELSFISIKILCIVWELDLQA